MILLHAKCSCKLSLGHLGTQCLVGMFGALHPSNRHPSTIGGDSVLAEWNRGSLLSWRSDRAQQCRLPEFRLSPLASSLWAPDVSMDLDLSAGW